jgi:hypothetical protein
MPGLGTFELIGLGSNLLSTAFGIGAERRRIEILSRAFDEAAGDVEREIGAREFAPTEAEAGVIRGAQRRTLSQLSQRGVIESSFAPAEVAEAGSEIELLRAQDIDEKKREARGLRLASAAVQSGAPGFEDFLGAQFGEVGGTLASLGGRRQAAREREIMLKRLERLLGSQNQFAT